jgi:hypothetical protein
MSTPETKFQPLFELVYCGIRYTLGWIMLRWMGKQQVFELKTGNL